tara:strand:- start:932 stop:1096 length:165 start_codon:yes stop_codon:yes gene_type:complete
MTLDATIEEIKQIAIEISEPVTVDLVKYVVDHFAKGDTGILMGASVHFGLIKSN